MSRTGTRGSTLGTGHWVPGVRRSVLEIGPKTKRPVPTAGFTLIELLVVLAGLAIVAAAIVPAVTGAGQRADLDGAATRVVASTRFARESAVERQDTVGLTVEQEPMRVQLAVEDMEAGPVPSVGGRQQVSQPPLPARYAAVRLPAGVFAHLEPAPEDPDVTSSASPAPLVDGGLRFTPDGRTSGGVVVLTDARGRERRIVVTPETGVVRVEDGDGR